MKSKKVNRAIFQRDEDFLTWLAREANSDNYREACRRVEQGLHPTDDILYEYVSGGLDEQDTRIIKAHIAFCGTCAEEVLRLRLVEEELEERAFDWANRGDYPPLSLSGEELGIATEYWEPQWVAQQATAADIPEERHIFRGEDGDIIVSCSWRGQYRKKPAYITVAWQADVTTRKELRLRFIDPETRQELADVYLGSELAGEEDFTNDELGFDPSCKKWAMALVIKEVRA